MPKGLGKTRLCKGYGSRGDKVEAKSKSPMVDRGDNNTKFFHRIASTRHSTNFISKLRINNEIVEDLSRIKNHVAAFFMYLYKDPEIARPKLDGVSFKSLKDSQKDWLERPFEESEVKQIVWSIEDDKAPSLDGFTMAFFKSYWEVVKRDIMETMENFYKEAFSEKGSNTTFICLVPKKEGADLIKDLRRINLVGNMYKIISKILACNLKEVINDIISPNQSVFIGGCQCTDGVLIANERIDAMMR